MANPPGIPISESSPLITSDFDEPPAALLTTLAFDIERHTNGQLDDQAFTLTGLYVGISSTVSGFTWH